jgi:hypothetical protein
MDCAIEENNPEMAAFIEAYVCFLHKFGCFLSCFVLGLTGTFNHSEGFVSMLIDDFPNNRISKSQRLSRVKGYLHSRNINFS